MHPYFPAQSRNGLRVVYTVTPEGKEEGYSNIPPISDTKRKITGEDESDRGLLKRWVGIAALVVVVVVGTSSLRPRAYIKGLIRGGEERV